MNSPAAGKLRWRPTDTAEYDLAPFTSTAITARTPGHWITTARPSQTSPARTSRRRWSPSTPWVTGRSAYAHSLEASLSYTDAELQQRYDADWVSDAFCNTLLCSYGNDTAQEMFDRDRDRW